MSFAASIQAALYAKLNAADLDGATVRDIAPQAFDSGAASGFPLVLIGRIVITQLDTSARRGVTFVARIHTWTQTGSLLACKQIQDKIYAALHQQDLTLTGLNAVFVKRDSSDCWPDEGGRAHGVCEYRGLIEAG